jgi:hypothetical protein
MQTTSEISSMPAAFAILLAPEAMTGVFSELQEWFEERRDQVGLMVAAHKSLTEAFGQLAE